MTKMTGALFFGNEPRRPKERLGRHGENACQVRSRRAGDDRRHSHVDGEDEAQAALKVPTDSEVEAMLDPAGKEMATKLKAMKGAEFERRAARQEAGN